MLSPRPLALVAFALLTITATAAAQSSAPLSASPAPARDSRTEVPKVPAAPQAAVMRQIPTRIIVLKAGSPIARKDSVCYSLRTYQFDQATAGESAKLSGQSTCVPATTANAIAVVTPH